MNIPRLYSMTMDELKEELAGQKELLDTLVGTLWPPIVESYIRQIEDRIHEEEAYQRNERIRGKGKMAE